MLAAPALWLLQCLRFSKYLAEYLSVVPALTVVRVNSCSMATA